MSTDNLFKYANSKIHKEISSSVMKSITKQNKETIENFFNISDITSIIESLNKNLSEYLEKKSLEKIEFHPNKFDVSAIENIEISTTSEYSNNSDNYRVEVFINSKKEFAIIFPKEFKTELNSKHIMDNIVSDIKNGIIMRITSKILQKKLRFSPLKNAFIKADDFSKDTIEKFDLSLYEKLKKEDNKRIKFLEDKFKSYFNIEIQAKEQSINFQIGNKIYSYDKLSSGYKRLTCILLEMIGGFLIDYSYSEKYEMLFIIEEPESHLSLHNIINFSKLISDLVESPEFNSCFVISTHSDVFVNIMHKKYVSFYEFRSFKTNPELKEVHKLSKDKMPLEMMKAIDEMVGISD